MKPTCLHYKDYKHFVDSKYFWELQFNCMFLWFELSYDPLTCIDRLDNGINLSTEITKLVY